MLVTERGLYIGNALKELRRQHAFTQKELAVEADLSEITISDLENNKRGALPRTVRKLAKALQVEVQELTKPRSELRLQGGARSEEHRDAFLDREDELRAEMDTDKKKDGDDSEPGGGST